MEFVDGMDTELSHWGIDAEIIVASAHKVPIKVAHIIEANNAEDDLVYVTVAGRSNALSGVVAANSVHPVIACPPHKTKEDFMVNINSTLMMPSETPVMAVLDRANVILAIVKMFALKDKTLRGKMMERLVDVKKKFDD